MGFVRLFKILLGLALLYALYWGGAYIALQRGLDRAEAQAPAKVVYGARSTAGFPSRLDTTWTDLNISGAGWAYDTPLAQLLALSYRPDGAVAFAPGPHRLMINGVNLTLMTEDARASLRIRPNAQLLLKRGTAELSAAQLAVNGAPVTRLDHGVIAIRNGAGESPRADLWIDLQSLGFPAQAAAEASAATPIDRVSLDADLGLSGPLALRGDGPVITDITLRAATLNWGAATLQLTGSLAPDFDGRLNGELSLTGTDWQIALDRAVEAGIMEPSLADTWRSFGETLGGADGLDMVLPVRGGRIMLGLIPIAELPRLPRPYPG